MKFVEVEKLPPKDKYSESNAKKKLYDHLDEFMAMNIKIARVEYRPDEYKHAYSAYESILRACRKHPYPIEVYLRKWEVYLVRTDL